MNKIEMPGIWNHRVNSIGAGLTEEYALRTCNGNVPVRSRTILSHRNGQKLAGWLPLRHSVPGTQEKKKAPSHAAIPHAIPLPYLQTRDILAPNNLRGNNMRDCIACIMCLILLSIALPARADVSYRCKEVQKGRYAVSLRMQSDDYIFILEGVKIDNSEYTLRHLDEGDNSEILVTITGRNQSGKFYQFSSEDLTVKYGEQMSNGGGQKILEEFDCVWRDELLERVKKNLRSVFDLDADEVTPETGMSQIAKSKKHTVVIKELVQREFCVDLTSQDAKTISTVRELSSFIDRKNPDGRCRL
jgi:acyl carrier protein